MSLLKWEECYLRHALHEQEVGEGTRELRMQVRIVAVRKHGTIRNRILAS